MTKECYDNIAIMSASSLYDVIIHTFIFLYSILISMNTIYQSIHI